MKVTQFCTTLCDHISYADHGILQARILEGVAFPISRDLPKPGIEPRSPALQADSLPAEPQVKPKITGMGSLSLLQGIILTKESNRDLLHCRQKLFFTYIHSFYTYIHSYTYILGKEMATHSNILAWRILWTEEPGRLQSMGSLESDTT